MILTIKDFGFSKLEEILALCAFYLFGVVFKIVTVVEQLSRMVTTDTVLHSANKKGTSIHIKKIQDAHVADGLP